MSVHKSISLMWRCILIGGVGFLASNAQAIDDPKSDSGARLAEGAPHFTAPALHVAPSIEMLRVGSESARRLLASVPALAADADAWEVRLDGRSDRPQLIQGKGYALLPGRGNQLSITGWPDAQQVTLAQVERQLRSFLADSPQLFRIAAGDLRLDRSRSTAYGPGKYFWTVEFQQTYRGVPVEDAHIFFRINHGNIVQMGSHRVADIAVDTKPTVAREEAFLAATNAVGLDARVSRMVDQGTLKVFPTLISGEGLGFLYSGARGSGYAHRLAWDFTFEVEGSDHAYRILADAHSGVVLEFLDLTRFAEVTGEVYPKTNTDPLMSVPFPSAKVTNNGTKITDANGQYDYSGGTASIALDGRYIRISDNCGSISLSASSPGDLDLGGSGGTDCTTPGFGGAGNTHSARTGFYHLTNINRKAATFLPNNNWIDGTLTANMNVNQTCNASWNGSAVNFYRSGSGCSNTGEIAAVFLHEWGHGMDANSGGAASENGSGEALGDVFAFLETRDACIGENFRPGVACPNCRSYCTGVRDVAAFATGGISTIARPDTVGDDNGINCDRYNCPYFANGIFPYQGPMGYQGHCESHIASSSVWDLTQALIGVYGAGGWGAMDTIWYGSLTPTKSAYRVASGGKCNPNASVDGCASNNWYTVFLSVDDDDGDLSNGTPHGCLIWDAFNAHGIACGTRPDCSGGCTPQPTADAGPDQTIVAGDSVTIGTAAVPDHTYSWSPGGQTTAQITVSPASTTTYTVTATTACGSADDSVVVTVQSGQNNPPIANAGGDQNVNEGDSVTLDGTGSSDPDGDSITYAWTQTAGPTVSLSGANTAQSSFTAPAVDANTTLTFDLVVNDGQVNSTPDSVNVVVAPLPDQTCVTSSNSDHVSAGRANRCGFFNLFACAVGSNDNLGWIWGSSSVIETSAGYWEETNSCP